MAQIDICPRCSAVLLSLMDKRSGKTIKRWDHKKKRKIEIKYKKITYRCEGCNYKFKDDEVHY